MSPRQAGPWAEEGGWEEGGVRHPQRPGWALHRRVVPGTGWQMAPEVPGRGGQSHGQVKS